MRALLAFVLVCQIFAFSAQAEEKTFAQALLDDDQAELASLEARGGFDPDAVLPDYYGATALMITAEKRDPKSTRVLLAMPDWKSVRAFSAADRLSR